MHFNVVHRKVDWRNPKMKSLNSMPALSFYFFEYLAIIELFIVDDDVNPMSVALFNSSR